MQLSSLHNSRCRSERTSRTGRSLFDSTHCMDMKAYHFLQTVECRRIPLALVGVCGHRHAVARAPPRLIIKLASTLSRAVTVCRHCHWHVGTGRRAQTAGEGRASSSSCVYRTPNGKQSSDKGPDDDHGRLRFTAFSWGPRAGRGRMHSGVESPFASPRISRSFFAVGPATGVFFFSHY